MLLQLLFVLVAIIIGARVGGIGLGILGGLGLAVLTFVFGLQPTAPPIDVMLMIVAVIAAASCMQAAGGLDLMVKWAEKILRKNPHHITLLSPFVTYFFTFFAGTGHVAYSVLPVIAEVAKDTGIRPERPLGIAVIASQQAITASPISAATVAMLSMLAGYNISLFDILKISIPCTLAGVLLGALYSMKVGKELKDDPEYQRRLAAGEISGDGYHTTEVASHGKALTSVILFLAATIGIVLFGSIAHYRSVDAFCRLTHFAIHKNRWYQGGKRFCFQCRNAGRSCNFWYRMDGRYLHRRKHGSDEREYFRPCYRYALAVWCGLIPDVHLVVQSGSYRSFSVTARHSTRHFSLYAYRAFPSCERLFFPTQLSDSDSRHKL